MQRNLWGSLVAVGAVAAIVSAPPACAREGEQFAFELPAQDLSASLRALSVQTGQSIVASGDLVRGRQAPAVSGSLTVEAALRALLAGSGLEARRAGDALVIVNAGGGESPAPAELAGEVPQAEGGTIVVTGSHLRGAPASSPVIVIGREEIEQSGATSVEQLMRKLPQNSRGGVNQENFGITIPDQDVTDHGAGVNLRGLGQRATLVLLDGRRMAPSGYGAYVDISLIPLSLIDRVEVLTDGASAIYGSDAVGGVVNFILRDRLDGLETTVQAGTTTRGGGEQLLLSQAGGASWSGGHGLLAYELRGENEIRASERDFTVDLRPDAFLTPRERRHSVLASVEQAVADRLTFNAVGTYAHRTTERTYFGSESPLPLGAHAVADSVTLSGELTYVFAGDWRAQLEGSYGLSDTDQQQTQPGGAELANARDVRNEVYGGAVRLDGSLFELPGGAVRVALGGELRRESYRDGFESSAFARTVKQAGRDVTSLFGEISVPLMAVFVAALVLRNASRDHDYHERLHDFAEAVERLLMMLLLVLLGGSIAYGGLLAPLDRPTLLFVAAVLLAARPLAGLASLSGSPLQWREKLVIAFFGIRGMGSIYYMAFALNSAVFGDPRALWTVVGAVVFASILLHGITVTPALQLLDRWQRKRPRPDR